MPNPVHIRRRFRGALLLTLLVLVYATVTGLGSLQALLTGPVALMVAFALVFDSSEPGSPWEIALRWVAGLAGLALLLAAMALVVGAAFMFVAGQRSSSSMGMEWLLIMVAVPFSLAIGVSGYVLLMMGATGRRKRSHKIDLDAARNSEAVRRFDRMHGPGSGETEGPTVKPS